MADKEKSKVAGGISGYIQGKNAEIVDRIFKELDEYHKDKSQVICLGKLLEHIGETFGYKSIIAYLVKTDTAELLYEEPPNTSVAKQLETDLFIRNDIKEMTFAPIQYENGALFKIGIVPVICSPGYHVVIYFEGIDPDIHTFETRCLPLALKIWFASFEAKIQKFRSALLEFKQGTKGLPSIFDMACHIHPWLKSSDMCELCEAAIAKIEQSAEGQNLKDKFKEQFENLGKRWHCCLDRNWPCDSGEGFNEDEYGPLGWYLSRIQDEK